MKKRGFRLKYPKFTILILTFIIAYLLFKAKAFLPFRLFLLSLGYEGTFLIGMFFSSAFTAAPATAALLIVAKQQNIFLASFLGGFGALLGDLLIFKFIRFSFADEIKKLSKEKIFNHKKNKKYHLFKKYLILVLAGFIIASPLPDEIGVTLLACSRNVSIKSFMLMSYLLNTIGIFVIFIIGNLL